MIYWCFNITSGPQLRSLEMQQIIRFLLFREANMYTLQSCNRCTLMMGFCGEHGTFVATLVLHYICKYICTVATTRRVCLRWYKCSRGISLLFPTCLQSCSVTPTFAKWVDYSSTVLCHIAFESNMHAHLYKHILMITWLVCGIPTQLPFFS